mgnify:CR=1 FL=1
MAMSDPGEVPGGGEDPRLASLEDRLKAAHHTEKQRTAPPVANAAFTGKGVSQGNRVLSALIGVPIGSFAVGLAIDWFFGTRPVAMLVMLFLGIISAFVQIWRISQQRAE